MDRLRVSSVGTVGVDCAGAGFGRAQNPVKGVGDGRGKGEERWGWVGVGEGGVVELVEWRLGSLIGRWGLGADN